MLQTRESGAMRTDAVIFDLGNTLVSYYSRSQWPDVLDQSIEEVSNFLMKQGLLGESAPDLAERVQAQRGEGDELRVRLLADRLQWIFRLPDRSATPETVEEMCRSFLRPIFATARLYDDALPTLEAIRQRGIRTGILSNTPWGSPGAIWREELARHGLLTAVDAAAFCTDVGYRKPHPRPFEYILGKLATPAERCLFVGDDPRWDIAGPRGIGMDAVLIDRTGAPPTGAQAVIQSLTEVLDLI